MTIEQEVANDLYDRIMGNAYPNNIFDRESTKGEVENLENGKAEIRLSSVWGNIKIKVEVEE